MIGCLRTRVRKQPIIELYFEFETVLKIYDLGAWQVYMFNMYHWRNVGLKLFK